jgi:hypothetical protein
MVGREAADQVRHSRSAQEAERANALAASINMRSFLGSPLVVFRKGLKLTRNRSVAHGSSRAWQSLGCFQIFVASS